MMPFNNLPDVIEPQAKSLYIVNIAGWNPVKATKYFLAVFLGNANAIISKFELNVLFGLTQFNINLWCFVAIFYGII